MIRRTYIARFDEGLLFLDIIAPWIVDSWLEAFGAWAFALPTVELERELALVATGAAGLVLLLVSTISIRHLPKPARRAAHLLLIPVLALPAAAPRAIACLRCSRRTPTPDRRSAYRTPRPQATPAPGSAAGARRGGPAWAGGGSK